jgi:copper chaperone CopZ
MKKVTFEIPAMYGDHHVQEVRKLLLGIAGVGDVYASSAFRVVEVTYDPAKVTDLDISVKLDAAGYLGEWTMTAEPGVAITELGGQGSFFRHTAIYEQSRQVVGFSQKVGYEGRPLWPCPGMGVIRGMMDEET